MKNLLFILILLTSVSGMTQEKVNVKIKKDQVLLDKSPWSSFSRAGGKFFVGILNGGDEFMSYTFESFGTGRYHTNGTEIKESYIVVEFYDKNLPEELNGEFEINMGAKEMFRLLAKHEVIKDNAFNIEGALEFKTRYAQDISGRRFLTK